MTTRNAVTYADGVTEVLPGDRVSVRQFFRRRNGEVIYVPGISPRRSSYEHNGLTWVGVSLPKGWAVGTLVLPDTQRLQSSVRFIARGSASAAAGDAMARLDHQEAEEAFQEAIDEQAPPAPAAKPRAIDWIAGIAAIGLQLAILLGAIAAFALLIRFLRRLF